MPTPYLEALFSLTGRRALVTGGSSGIGQAIAEALGRAGAAVVLMARRPDPLRAAAEELRAAGCTADWVAADLGDRAAVRAGADEVAHRFGEPDILVNAAGVNPRPPMDELSTEEWDRTMAVNLDAPYLLGQRFGPGMAERGWGRILHIASQQSVRAFGNSGAYGVSKAGLAALTRSQAEAWSRQGVCVNALAPGFVRTPLNAAVFADPVRTEAMARRTMAGRNGELADFAGAAVFLAGPGAAYVTGQTVFVDGGFSVT
ncbi:SDR family NAD(P)-dependent oxidoreductase [Streptomyces sp. NPDC004296]|uniref:SDR family NAD(P)-dependent oxidoreductase n=1 Tax=Streptomyces sp. NPDC004296 TaxID=3364697 RepID=UPI0036B42823